MIYHSLHSVGTHRSLEEISERAIGLGYGTAIMPLVAASGRAASGAFTRLREMAVDAVIVIFPSPFDFEQALELPNAVPVVVLGPPQGRGSSSVDFDQIGGAKQAVEHLLALGHPTVHHIAGPEGSFAAEVRLEVWRGLLEAEGRRVPDVRRGDWSATSGYEETKRMLEHETPTALFLGNDQMALGAYRALHEAGLRVPEDVSVIGFDDNDEAAMYSPPLTTIAQDWAILGELAITTALSMTRGAEPTTKSVPQRLVVRESTAPYHGA